MGDRSAGPELERPRPNLFEFATSELSQDAFVAWLLAWADPRYQESDPLLHGAAVGVLNRMLTLSEVEPPPKYESVQVDRQRDNVDVLALINGRIAVLIEDKTRTSEHSNQLERYFSKLCAEYPPESVAAIYLKTGDQCDYSQVEGADYACFGRREFLEQLRAGRSAGVSNDIYSDFLNHLERIEVLVNRALRESR